MTPASAHGDEQRETEPGRGRFAPSPSAPLHVGNLRTALIAWLAARSTEREFLIRIEDLDPTRSRPDVAGSQLDDLIAIGLDWDAQPVNQSDRHDLYAAAFAQLESLGLTYPCWCTRGELAASAPHGGERRYPGTCRDITRGQRAERERSGRNPSIRARLDSVRVDWDDGLLGHCSGIADDPILIRSDGAWAYHLAVISDDNNQAVDQVVRGDDLAPSVPTQAALIDALGWARPEWVHVPLVVGTDGARLAKRHGAVTLAELASEGLGPADVLAILAAGLDLQEPCERLEPTDLLERFELSRIPPDPLVWSH